MKNKEKWIKKHLVLGEKEIGGTICGVIRGPLTPITFFSGDLEQLLDPRHNFLRWISVPKTIT